MVGSMIGGRGGEEGILREGLVGSRVEELSSK